jgi:peptidyl-prolyl cis-trans isomerase D
VTGTPLIMANGTSRADASYKLPAELAPILKTGFEIAQNDPPEVIALGGDAGYAVVSPGDVVAAAPAPLASIRNEVATDWVNEQALDRARAAANQIAAKASSGATIAEAMKGIGVALPAARPLSARRIQIADPEGTIPAALKLLFTIGTGKSRAAAAPGAAGFFVVKVNKITPGNAIAQPGLITRMQQELAQAAAQDYAQQFVADIKRRLKVKRNQGAIDAFRARMLTTGG